MLRITMYKIGKIIFINQVFQARNLIRLRCYLPIVNNVVMVFLKKKKKTML